MEHAISQARRYTCDEHRLLTPKPRLPLRLTLHLNQHCSLKIIFHLKMVLGVRTVSKGNVGFTLFKVSFQPVKPI